MRYATVAVGVRGWEALIALLRTPIIDLALHIVGGSEAVLEQARRFLEIRWLSAPASLANLVLLDLVTRRAICPCASNFVSGRQYPQHCAGCLAGDGAAYERAGRGAGDGYCGICNIADWSR